MKVFKSKWFWAAMAIFGLAALYNYCNQESGSTKRDTLAHQNPPPPAPALTADDFIRSQPLAPSLGVYEANDAELNGISVPAKMNAKMQILGDVPVAFGYYIDGKLVCKWSATGKREGKEITTSGEHSEGYKLEPGNPVRSVKVAYIIYSGPAPKDDSWIPLAQAASASSRN